MEGVSTAKVRLLEEIRIRNSDDLYPLNNFLLDEVPVKELGVLLGVMRMDLEACKRNAMDAMVIFYKLSRLLEGLSRSLSLLMTVEGETIPELAEMTSEFLEQTSYTALFRMEPNKETLSGFVSVLEGVSDIDAERSVLMSGANKRPRQKDDETRDDEEEGGFKRQRGLLWVVEEETSKGLVRLLGERFVDLSSKLDAVARESELTRASAEMDVFGIGKATIGKEGFVETSVLLNCGLAVLVSVMGSRHLVEGMEERDSEETVAILEDVVKAFSTLVSQSRPHRTHSDPVGYACALFFSCCFCCSRGSFWKLTRGQVFTSYVRAHGRDWCSSLISGMDDSLDGWKGKAVFASFALRLVESFDGFASLGVGAAEFLSAQCGGVSNALDIMCNHMAYYFHTTKSSYGDMLSLEDLGLPLTTDLEEDPTTSGLVSLEASMARETNRIWTQSKEALFNCVSKSNEVFSLIRLIEKRKEKHGPLEVAAFETVSAYGKSIHDMGVSLSDVLVRETEGLDGVDWNSKRGFLWFLLKKVSFVGAAIRAWASSANRSVENSTRSVSGPSTLAYPVLYHVVGMVMVFLGIACECDGASAYHSFERVKRRMEVGPKKDDGEEYEGSLDFVRLGGAGYAESLRSVKEQILGSQNVIAEIGL